MQHFLNIIKIVLVTRHNQCRMTIIKIHKGEEVEEALSLVTIVKNKAICQENAHKRKNHLEVAEEEEVEETSIMIEVVIDKIIKIGEVTLVTEVEAEVEVEDVVEIETRMKKTSSADQ